MDFLVWERETGEEGTLHIQGYVRFKNRKTLSSVKALLTTRAHAEPARGSEQQNRDYCSKDREQADGDWAEHGTLDPTLRQGRRTDITNAAALIKEGASMREVADQFPDVFTKYQSGLQSLALMIGPEPPIRRSVTTTVLWGEPGVGKTHRVRTAYPEAFIVLPGRDPFGTYCRQETIIFEEFNDSEWPIRKMNVLLDVWKAELDSRYQNKVAWWTKIFILSNTPSSTWYQNEMSVHRQSFARRITYEVEIKTRDQELLLI